MLSHSFSVFTDYLKKELFKMHANYNYRIYFKDSFDLLYKIQKVYYPLRMG